MKKCIAIVLMSFISVGSFAYVSENSEYVSLTCQLADASPDYNITLKLFHARVGAVSRLEVVESTIAGANTFNYSVKPVAVPQGANVKNIAYKGQGIELDISNTEEDQQGNRPASLLLSVNTRALVATTRLENMICQQHIILF